MRLAAHMDGLIFSGVDLFIDRLALLHQSRRAFPKILGLELFGKYGNFVDYPLGNEISLIPDQFLAAPKSGWGCCCDMVCNFVDFLHECHIGKNTGDKAKIQRLVRA